MTENFTTFEPLSEKTAKLRQKVTMTTTITFESGTKDQVVYV